MGRRERREIARTICIKADMFNSQNDKNSFFFIADSSDSVVSMGVITDKPQKTNLGVEKFLKSIDRELSTITAADIIEPLSSNKVEKQKIGFC